MLPAKCRMYFIKYNILNQLLQAKHLCKGYTNPTLPTRGSNHQSTKHFQVTCLLSVKRTFKPVSTSPLSEVSLVLLSYQAVCLFIVCLFCVPNHCHMYQLFPCFVFWFWIYMPRRLYLPGFWTVLVFLDFDCAFCFGFVCSACVRQDNPPYNLLQQTEYFLLYSCSHQSLWDKVQFINFQPTISYN